MLIDLKKKILIHYQLYVKNTVKSISPYEIVSFQECERLNSIFSSCLKTLEDLVKGLLGELDMTV